MHARGAGAHGVFRGYGTAATVTTAGFLADGRRDAGLRPVLDRARARAARPTRSATPAASRRSSTPTRAPSTWSATTSRSSSSRTASSSRTSSTPASRTPTARSRRRRAPTTPSGTSSRCTPRRTHHTHLEHVRPGHPALLPDDGGLRRPHLPAGQRRGRDLAGEVPLEAASSGVHSLVWEEAQIIAGMDPDFHRRDLADAIEAGAFPQWELGVQVLPDTADQMFEGIDLLDPTKIVPEELAPGAADRAADAQPQPDQLLRRDRAGRLPPRPPGPRHRRHRRPAAAGAAVLLPRHPAHPARRPELRARSRSTARTRRSTTCSATASTRHAVHAGVAPYRPNSLDGGCPFLAGAGEGALRRGAAAGAEARKVRDGPASFDDHFSQARLFWPSLTPVEQDHIIDAYTFELGKCYEQAIKERKLRRARQHRRRAVRRGRRRPGPAGARGDGRRRPTSTRARPCPRSAARGRPTAGSSGSSPTSPATWPR